MIRACSSIRRGGQRVLAATSIFVSEPQASKQGRPRRPPKPKLESPGRPDVCADCGQTVEDDTLPHGCKTTA